MEDCEDLLVTDLKNSVIGDLNLRNWSSHNFSELDSNKLGSVNLINCEIICIPEDSGALSETLLKTSLL